MTTKQADIVELHDLRDDSILCKYRAIGHMFDENPGVDVPEGERAYYAAAIMSFACLRCGREKFIYFDVNGSRMGQPYYRNPTDFQHTRRLSHQEIELEILHRGLMTTFFDPKVQRNAVSALAEIERFNQSQAAKPKKPRNATKKKAAA